MLSEIKTRTNDASWLVQVTMIDQQKYNGVFYKGGGLQRILNILNNQSTSYYYRGLAARTLAYVLKSDPNLYKQITSIDTTMSSLIYLISEAESQVTISKNDATKVRLNAIIALTLVNGGKTHPSVELSIEGNEDLVKMDPYPEYVDSPSRYRSNRQSIFDNRNSIMSQSSVTYPVVEKSFSEPQSTFVTNNFVDSYRATHPDNNNVNKSHLNINELNNYDKYMKKVNEKNPYIVENNRIDKITSTLSSPNKSRRSSPSKTVLKPLENPKKIKQKDYLFLPYDIKNLNGNVRELMPADVLLDQLNPPNQRDIIPKVLANSLKRQNINDEEYPMPEITSLPISKDAMILYDDNEYDDSVPDWIKRVNVINKLQKSTEMLSKSLKTVTKTVKTIESNINVQIVSNKKNLPLKFLFEKAGDAYYCRNKLLKILIKWGKYQIYSIKRKTFFMLFNNVKRQRHIKNCRIKSLTLLDTLMKRYRDKQIDSYYVFLFHKWKNWVEYCISHEQDIGALAFQKVYRGYKDRKIYKILKLRYISARSIQALYRKHVCRKRYLKIRKSIIIIQSFVRMLRPLKNFKNAKSAIIKIQAVARMLNQTKKYDKMKLAAMMLHMNVRCYLSKVKAKQLIKEKLIEKEVMSISAHIIQNTYRKWMAKRVLINLKKEKNILSRAALRIQRCYYRYHDNFSSFVLIRCLTISDKCDRLIKKQNRRKKKLLCVIKIQRFFRFYHRKREGLKNAKEWRKRYKAACTLQKYFHSEYVKRDCAARDLQRIWLKSKPNRMFKYLHNRLIRMREEEERKLFNIKNEYAIRIQKAYHHFTLIRYLKRAVSCRLIQRVYKGHLSRKIKRSLLQTNIHFIINKLFSYSIPLIVSDAAEKLLVIEKRNAKIIQRRYRIHRKWVHHKQYIEKCKKEYESAKLIQKNYRHFIDKRNLKRYIRLSKSRKTGLYRDVPNIRDVINNVLSDILQYYSPKDNLVGIRVPLLLRRLGLHEYTNNFLNNGCTSIEILRSMKDSDLEMCGVKEESDRNNIYGLFQHQRPIMLAITTIKNENEIIDEYLKVFPNRKMRATNFAKQAILTSELSFLCLRRYLRKYSDNISKIKSNMDKELIYWDNCDNEIKYEKTRLKKALDLLTSACLRISDLCPDISLCREAGRIAEAVENVSLEESLTSMYNILHKLYINNNIVVIIQRFMKRFVAWKHSRTLLEKLKRDKIMFNYISYYKLNRVKKAWDKMIDEDNTKYKMLLLRKERNKVLSQLVMVTRYGWSKALDNNKKVYFLNSKTKLSSYERIIYTVEEYRAIIKIQSILRMKLCKNELKRRKRKIDEKIDMIEKAKEFNLPLSKQKRNQYISLKYDFETINCCELPPKELKHVGKECIGRKLKILMYTDFSWPEVKEASNFMIEDWRNRCEEENKESEKQIAFHQSRLNELKKDISPLQSMLEYYRLIQRGSKNKKTSTPKKVKKKKTIGQRLNKTVPPMSEYEVQNMLDPLKEEYMAILDEIKELNSLIRVNNEQYTMIKEDNNCECENMKIYKTAIVLDYDKITKRHLLRFSSNYQKWVDLRERTYEWVDKNISIKINVKLENSFICPRYGCWYYVNQKTHDIIYYDINTLKECERIEYNFYEINAIIEIQRIYRGYRDRKKYKKKLKSFCLSAFIRECVRRGCNIGWIGYYNEGIDCKMYLSRLGYEDVYHYIENIYKDDEIVKLTQEGKILERNIELMRRQKLLKRKGNKVTLESDNIYYTKPDSDIIYHNNRDPSIKLQALKKLNVNKLEIIGIVSSQVRSRIMKCINDVELEQYSLSLIKDSDTAITYLPNGKIKEIPGPYDLYVNTYPRHANRVNDFITNLNKINGTISMGQLVSIFNEYPRVPPPTSELIPLLSNKYTVSSDSDVNSVYVLYRNTYLRIKVYVSLMKITNLKKLIDDSQVIIDDIYVNQSPKESALYIRKLFDKILEYDKYAIKIEALYKGFRDRRRVKANRAKLENVVNIISKFWRLVLAKHQSARLQQLYYAEWVECLHPYLKRKYYKHINTGEIQWEKPKDIPVKPYGLWPKQKNTINRNTEQGLCFMCGINNSVYYCNECEKEYCFNCYAKVHEKLSEKEVHTFKILEDNSIPLLKCIQCGELATITCEDCGNYTYCENDFTKLHLTKDRKSHKYVKYPSGCKVCCECENEVAIRHCNQCEDDFCISCFDKLHDRGNRKRHEYDLIRDKLDEGFSYCVVCNIRSTNQSCVWCEKPICESCMKFVHTTTSCPERPAEDSVLYLLHYKCVKCNKPAYRHCKECNLDYCDKSDIMGVETCFEKSHHNLEGHHIEEHSRCKYEILGIKIVKAFKKHLFRKYIKELIEKRKADELKKKELKEEHKRKVEEMKKRLEALEKQKKIKLIPTNSLAKPTT